MKNKTLAKALISVFALSSIFSTAFAAEDLTVKKHVVDVNKALYVPYYNKTDYPNGLPTGFGSGLTVKSVKDNGDIELYAITDRGPNTDGPNYVDGDKKLSAKFFPTPNFTPQIATIILNKKGAAITNSITLKDETGKNITGLPIAPGNIGSTNEIGLDEKLQKLPYDKNGMDTEAIAVDKQGNFWVCDEYGPFIAKLDKNGKLLKKYMPGNGLPEIIKYRQPNRGFEGLTIAPNGKVYAIVQSTLDINNETSKTAQFLRIVELDPATGKTKMFAYPHDISAYKSTKDAKIGDMYAISDNKILLIEQGKGADKKMRNLIYSIDLTDATDITGMKIDGKDLEYIEDSAKLSNIKFTKKELVVDLRTLGWEVEKAEGLTVLNDNKTILVINDNDFGVSLNVEDPQVAEPDITKYTLTSDGKFSFDKKATNPILKVVPNSEVERKLHLWEIKLSKALK